MLNTGVVPLDLLKLYCFSLSSLVEVVVAGLPVQDVINVAVLDAITIAAAVKRVVT